MFPQEIFVIFAGILGAVIGSFLSVLAGRLPRGEDVVWRRSHCPLCGTPLTFSDLIPLVSFLWQRGRCRHCRGRMSRRYLFLEFATAGLFGLTVLRCPDFTRCFFDLPVPVWWFLFSGLVLIAVIDYAYMIIPERVLAVLALTGLGARIIFTPSALGQAFVGALVGGGLFWLLVKVSGERWMGMGDAEVGAVLGVFLGFPAIGAALVGASLLGGTWASVVLVLGRKRFGDRLPFAPFLVAGGISAVFLWSYLTAFFLGL